MASIGSKARRPIAWEFIHNNARTIMHVNHFMFHPIKATVISRHCQPIKLLITLTTFKSVSGSHVVSRRRGNLVVSRQLSGSLYGFLGDVIHLRYCELACARGSTLASLAIT